MKCDSRTQTHARKRNREMDGVKFEEQSMSNWFRYISRSSGDTLHCLSHTHTQTLKHRHVFAIACWPSQRSIWSSATVDDSGESFQKLHTSKNKLTLISFVRWKINGSSMPDLFELVCVGFSSAFFAKSRKNEHFDTSTSALLFYRLWESIYFKRICSRAKVELLTFAQTKLNGTPSDLDSLQYDNRI